MQHALPAVPAAPITTPRAAMSFGGDQEPAMEPHQIESLRNLHRVISDNHSKLRGSLPEGVGDMDKVSRPLAITIRDILEAYGECGNAGVVA